MLSNDSVKLLEWLRQHDEWMTLDEIRSGYQSFDHRDLKSLKDQNMVDTKFNLEGSEWIQYRISNMGEAYLQNLRAQRAPEVREWINTLLPVITFLGGLLLSDPVKGLVRWFFGLFD